MQVGKIQKKRSAEAPKQLKESKLRKRVRSTDARCRDGDGSVFDGVVLPRFPLAAVSIESGSCSSSSIPTLEDLFSAAARVQLFSTNQHPTKVPDSSGSMGLELDEILDTSSGLEPFLEILVQPPKRGYRFRYESEGKTHGVIGTCNKNGTRQFPTVQIQHHQGPAKIIVTVVTDADPASLHPHVLIVNKNTMPGYHIVDVMSPQPIAFSNLSILHVRLENLTWAVEQRVLQQRALDACLQTLERHAGGAALTTADKHALKLITQSLNENKIPPLPLSEEQKRQVSQEVSARKESVNMKSVRLCFQAILFDANKQVTKVLPKVYSDSIIDAKTPDGAVLKISKLSRVSSKAEGGQEVIILSDKLSKDDIRVRFYQEENGKVIWEDFGVFAKNDVYKQVAIIMRTPPYKEKYLTHDVTVQMQLQRSTDLNCVSAPMNFTYKATDFDPYKIFAKKRKLTSHQDDNELHMMSGADAAGLASNVAIDPRGDFFDQDLLGQVGNLQPFRESPYEHVEPHDFTSRNEVMDFLQQLGLNFNLDQNSDELFAPRPAQ